MGDLRIRPVEPGDSAWVSDLVQEQWGAPLVVSRGQPHHVDRLPGFVALQGQDRVGLITYHVANRQCEIVTLNSLHPGQGYVLNGYPRLWPKVVNDLCFVVLFGVPYAALYRHCKR